ncbi:hypothetical protein PENDEC_c003G03275 [Penicillium decumbens]|uniref:Fungal N-terminal domain-containing protein n=1 Tax=Penicillium decumbens TaxID=69771 RepID=A0A1V6PJL8_PENDC|nr:hypothetical protein PENDEC_c003G03275 [Penicillium decumbens]
MPNRVSIADLKADAGKIISSLISYAKAVQRAKSEIRKLSEELFALRGILMHLSTETLENIPEWQQAESPDASSRDVILLTTSEFLQSLLRGLENPKTKSKRLKQKMQWPFTKEEVDGYLALLERLKSWLMLVLTADRASNSSELSNFTQSLNEELRIWNQERKELANKALIQWLAPVNPADAHLRASKAPDIGTGKWFIEGHLREFLGDENPTENILFLEGRLR